jgi:signal peptidase II
MGAAMAALIIWWVKAETIFIRCGLALCLGGAASHVIDRWIYGAVPDFFHFHWDKWSFYVFNISDSMISLGVGILLLDMLMPKRHKVE